MVLCAFCAHMRKSSGSFSRSTLLVFQRSLKKIKHRTTSMQLRMFQALLTFTLSYHFDSCVETVLILFYAEDDSLGSLLY